MILKDSVMRVENMLAFTPFNIFLESGPGASLLRKRVYGGPLPLQLLLLSDFEK
jgi:hypothetical protein